MGSQGISYPVRLSFFFCISDWPCLFRCLAHVINLATQALLAAHSSSKHYDPAKPTDHEPNIDDFLRDEIGLIRAITVKVSIFPFIFVLYITNIFFSKGPLLRKTQGTSTLHSDPCRMEASTHSPSWHEGSLVIHLQHARPRTKTERGTYYLFYAHSSMVNRNSSLTNLFLILHEMKQTRKSAGNSRR